MVLTANHKTLSPEIPSLIFNFEKPFLSGQINFIGKGTLSLL